MTRPQFIRWANRREKAADALQEARRLLVEMIQIDTAPGPVMDATDRADAAAIAALRALSAAFGHATSETKRNG